MRCARQDLLRDGRLMRPARAPGRGARPVCLACMADEALTGEACSDLCGCAVVPSPSLGPVRDAEGCADILRGAMTIKKIKRSRRGETARLRVEVGQRLGAREHSKSLSSWTAARSEGALQVAE